MELKVRNTFKSGDRVPKSGQYASLHSTPHAFIEHVFCVEGTFFRGCRMCPLGVFYRLEESCVPVAGSAPTEGALAA